MVDCRVSRDAGFLTDANPVVRAPAAWCFLVLWAYK